MAKKKNPLKTAPGKALADFVYNYRFLIRHYILNGNFESSAQRMNDACTNYQDFRIYLKRKVPGEAYQSYKRAVAIFSDLLDMSVTDVKADFADTGKRQTLLDLLDMEVRIIDSTMHKSRNPDYLRTKISFKEENAAS